MLDDLGLRSGLPGGFGESLVALAFEPPLGRLAYVGAKLLDRPALRNATWQEQDFPGEPTAATVGDHESEIHAGSLRREGWKRHARIGRDRQSASEFLTGVKERLNRHVRRADERSQRPTIQFAMVWD